MAWLSSAAKEQMQRALLYAAFITYVLEGE